MTLLGLLPIENADFKARIAAMTKPDQPRSFQEIILRLQSYWAAQ
ncbi:MAG: glycine--tRNA ligase subunit alpha, partial [Rhodobacteraceae bacterium]